MTDTPPIRVSISGAAGRMGQALCRLTLQDESLQLASALEAPGFPHLGKDIGEISGRGPDGLPVSADVAAGLQHTDVLVDFTRPDATLRALDVLQGSPAKAAIIGTTGFTEEQFSQLQAKASDIAIVYSGNYSLGINLLSALVAQASRALGEDWDIEILETHHRHKVDAPSGTALLLGEAAARGKDAELSSLRLRPYDGDGKRVQGGIGFSVRRSGGVIGEHEVSFGSEEEVLSLSHSALNRDVFAKGALRAAKWAAHQPPGWYAMNDVLGL